MIVDMIVKWDTWVVRREVKLREMLPSFVKHKLEEVASSGIVIRARKAIKIVFVVSVVVWLWQLCSIACGNSHAMNDLSYYQNQMKALDDEVEVRTSGANVAGLMVESFINGATFGLFDADGFNGPGKRYEKWSNEVERRKVEIQRGIDIAEADLSAFREKVLIRNVSFVVAIVVALFLLLVPSQKLSESQLSDYGEYNDK